MADKTVLMVDCNTVSNVAAEAGPYNTGKNNIRKDTSSSLSASTGVTLSIKYVLSNFMPKSDVKRKNNPVPKTPILRAFYPTFLFLLLFYLFLGLICS